MSALIPTRAQDLGVNVGQLKRATASRIKKAKALMVELSGLWGDIDQAMVNEADNMAERLDELSVSLDHSVELLREGWDSSDG